MANAKKTVVKNSAIDYAGMNKNAKEISAFKGLTTNMSSTMRYLPKVFTNVYNASAFAQNIVNFPVFDSLSKWRSWGGNDAQNKAILSEERRLGIKPALMEAYASARLYGGCAVLIVTEDEDYSLPLDPTKLAKGGITSLSVIPRNDFKTIDVEASPGKQGYGEATMFHLQLRTLDNGQSINAIHPSRLVVFRGERRLLPNGTVDIANYWGDSILQSRMSGIIALESVYNNTEFMVYEARMPYLAVSEYALDDGEPGAMQRTQVDMSEFLTMFSENKGNFGLAVIDKETMELGSIDFNFTGIPAVIKEFIARVAAEANIPAAILLGKSPDGLNSSGESDFRIYYDRIKADQELIIQPAMQILDMALVRSALGTTNDDLTYTWNELNEIDDLKRAQIFNLEAQKIRDLVQDGLLDEAPAKEIIAKMLTESRLGQ